MSDSGIIHPLVVNAELGIDILQSDNGPTTDHPDAPVGCKAYDPATGDWSTKKSAGWEQDGTISDVYTKTESDARYLQLSGGALTGNLSVDGLFELFGTGLDGTTYQHFTLYADTTNDLLFEAPLGADNSTKLDYRFGWRGTAPGSGFGMKILGAGGGDMYGTWTADDLVSSGRVTATDSIGSGGQVRAAGWWVSGDPTPLAAEIGVDSSIAYLISYDRGAATYGSLHVNATDISLQAASGGSLTGDSVELSTTAFTYGGLAIARISSGTAAPTGTPKDCDIYFQHS